MPTTKIRKYVYEGSPPEGGIPINGVVSLTPQQQLNYDGRPFIMAGWFPGSGGFKTPDDAGNKANMWYTVQQPSGTRPASGWRDPESAPGYRVISKDGLARPPVALYGVVGTASDGVLYEQDTGRFYVLVDKSPDANTSGPGLTSDPLGYPPGPDSYEQGAADQADAGPPLVEFTVYESGDGFWVAKSPQTSASGNEKNPHRGISIINPGQWDKVAAGMSVREALDLDSYAQRGWNGMYSKRFLAWQYPGVTPAGEELASAMDAAEAGDEGAYRALRAVGIEYRGAPKEHSASGLLAALGL